MPFLISYSSYHGFTWNHFITSGCKFDDEWKFSMGWSLFVFLMLKWISCAKNVFQIYIRDQTLEPRKFFAFGRPCPLTCNEETERSIHSQCTVKKNGSKVDVRCSKSHHWLHKKTIADVVESLTGAFIVDSGFKAAIAFLNWMGIQVDFEPSKTDIICSMSRAFSPLANLMDVGAMEKVLGHEFTHKGLLVQAFVHPSYNNFGGCYQVQTHFSTNVIFLCFRIDILLIYLLLLNRDLNILVMLCWIIWSLHTCIRHIQNWNLAS